MKKNKRKGQSLVEYGLILSTISVVSIPALSMLGQQVKVPFQKVAIAIGSKSSSQTADAPYSPITTYYSSTFANNSEFAKQISVN